MFKIGQKVVFIGLNPDSEEIPSHRPEDGEICIISDIDQEDGLYCLAGYEYSDGMDGWMYDDTEIRPLDETFAEDVLAMITEQIEEEELVTV